MAADWEAMRLEYAATDISLRELAKKYGANERSVFRHSTAEDWQGERQRHNRQVSADVSALVSKQQAMEYAQLIDLSEQGVALGAEILAAVRENPRSYMHNPSKYLALISGIDKAELLFRRTHGLDNQQQTQQIQITITPPEGEELTEQDMGV